MYVSNRQLHFCFKLFTVAIVVQVRVSSPSDFLVKISISTGQLFDADLGKILYKIQNKIRSKITYEKNKKREMEQKRHRQLTTMSRLRMIYSTYNHV